MNKPLKTAKLEQVNSDGCKKTNRLLAQVRSLKPTQVVVWYAIDSSETGVLISEGTDRVKAVGALTASAMDVWNG